MNLTKFLEKQSVLRNSLYTLCSQATINIVSVFVAGYIATSLGDMDYGKFVFAFAFIEIFSSLTNMGVHVVQVREIARNNSKAPAFFAATLVFRVVLACLAYGGIAVIITFLNFPPITKKIVYIAGLTLIFNYIKDSCVAAFRAYEKMQLSAVINLASAFISVTLRTLVIYFGYRLLVLSWTMALISFVSALLPYYVLKKVLFEPKYAIDLKSLKSILLLTMPFYAMHLLMMAHRRVDVVILSFLKGDAEVAWYSASAMLILRLGFISSSICAAFFPVMSRLMANGNLASCERAFRDGLVVLFLIGVPLSIVLYVLADQVILLIYDKTFANAISVLRILSATIPIAFLTAHMQNTLFAFSKENIVTTIIALYTFISLILHLALIPTFGYIGAALSTCFAQFLSFFLTFGYIFFVLKLKMLEMRFLKILASSIFMAIVLITTANFHPLISVFMASLTYILAIFTFGVLPRSAVENLKLMILQNQQTY